jgi:hypothetical protein
MTILVLLMFVGGSVGAGVSYLQSYFDRHDPAAGAWFSRVSLFGGTALLIGWLLLDPTGVRAPVFALAGAAAYVGTHVACHKSTVPAEDESSSTLTPGDDNLP